MGMGQGVHGVGRSSRSRRQRPAKALKECQRSAWRKQVQVSCPKGKKRAVSGSRPRWPWNGVGAGWARSEWPGVSTQDVRGASCEGVDGLGQHESLQSLSCSLTPSATR